MAILTLSQLPLIQQQAVNTIATWREARQGVTIEDVLSAPGVVTVTTKPGGRKHFVGADGHIHSLPRPK